MSLCFAALITIAASAPPPPTPEQLRRADNSIVGLEAGRAIAFVSLWTIPIVYDVGMLSMMGAKKSLKTLYVDRYRDAPPEFGQSGDAAYGIGWAMKAGAVASLIALPQMTGEPLWGAFAFVILWLGGTFKHHEAYRMLYDQARHFENGIRDPDPPVIEGGPAGAAKPLGLKLALEF